MGNKAYNWHLTISLEDKQEDVGNDLHDAVKRIEGELRELKEIEGDIEGLKKVADLNSKRIRKILKLLVKNAS